MHIGKVLTLVAVVLSLGACSWFSSEEDDAAAPILAQRVPVPVASIQNIEIGRTRNGFAISAFGTAKGLGYTEPSLRARRDGAPAADGFLDYDFVALPPGPDAGYAPTASAEARAIRADLLLGADQLRGASGIRIHGAAGGMQIVF